MKWVAFGKSQKTGRRRRNPAGQKSAKEHKSSSVETKLHMESESAKTEFEVGEFESRKTDLEVTELDHKWPHCWVQKFVVRLSVPERNTRPAFCTHSMYSV